MKALAFTLSLFSFVATAQAETFYCVGNESYGTTKNIFVKLQPVGPSVNEVSEGTKVPYKLLVLNGAKIWADTVVQAAKEDVTFSFGANDPINGKIAGRIYLDELEESSIKLNTSELSLDCGDLFWE